MNNNLTSKQDEYFLSNITNMVKVAEHKKYAKFTDFLDERQQSIAICHLKKLGYESFHFYGGIDNCDRKMLGVFPSYDEIVNDFFPIETIELKYSNRVKLTHRDCLGALMSLQIDRCCIGDIVIDDGKAVFFVKKEIAEFILLNLNKIAKANVELEICRDKTIKKKQEYEVIEGTVSSMRLDCIVSLLTCKSRSASAKLIQSQMVKVNYFDIENISYIVKPNDVIVIRGKGKFIICSDMKTTKKNRIYITVNKLL